MPQVHVRLFLQLSVALSRCEGPNINFGIMGLDAAVRLPRLVEQNRTHADDVRRLALNLLGAARVAPLDEQVPALHDLHTVRHRVPRPQDLRPWRVRRKLHGACQRLHLVGRNDRPPNPQSPDQGRGTRGPHQVLHAFPSTKILHLVLRQLKDESSLRHDDGGERVEALAAGAAAAGAADESRGIQDFGYLSRRDVPLHVVHLTEKGTFGDERDLLHVIALLEQPRALAAVHGRGHPQQIPHSLLAKVLENRMGQ
mmetsp:Transcript_143309/g.357079  ORF Transcript_143309/g.357079 Transcript_143309/m.357079 type:complete len:255 (-) Transcript_143309:1283-2047(-)